MEQDVAAPVPYAHIEARPRKPSRQGLEQRGHHQQVADVVVAQHEEGARLRGRRGEGRGAGRGVVDEALQQGRAGAAGQGAELPQEAKGSRRAHRRIADRTAEARTVDRWMTSTSPCTKVAGSGEAGAKRSDVPLTGTRVQIRPWGSS